LSSYSWIMTTIFFLQTREPPILPKLQSYGCENDNEFYDPPISHSGKYVQVTKGVMLTRIRSKLVDGENSDFLGELLFGYFRFFGYEFNFYQHLVSIRLGRHPLRKVDELLKRNSKALESNSIFLCVEDPMEVGRVLSPHTEECQDAICYEFRRAMYLISRGASFQT